jgi:glutathione peroxidase
MALLSFTKKEILSEKPSIHGLKFKAINGQEMELSAFRGKKLLIVNVASKCGFTPQYQGLQELHEKYEDQLVVIGFPCNQFAGQEPGSSTEIQNFCSLNFGVSFLLTEKIDVKGDNQHPIYQWLTDKNLNKIKNSSVKWNFQKYLLDEEGRFIDVFYSVTKPMSEKILKHLK